MTLLVHGVFEDLVFVSAKPLMGASLLDPGSASSDLLLVMQLAYCLLLLAC
jgi:hypothetical protein